MITGLWQALLPPDWAFRQWCAYLAVTSEGAKPIRSFEIGFNVPAATVATSINVLGLFPAIPQIGVMDAMRLSAGLPR